MTKLVKSSQCLFQATILKYFTGYAKIRSRIIKNTIFSPKLIYESLNTTFCSARVDCSIYEENMLSKTRKTCSLLFERYWKIEFAQIYLSLWTKMTEFFGSLHVITGKICHLMKRFHQESVERAFSAVMYLKCNVCKEVLSLLQGFDQLRTKVFAYANDIMVVVFFQPFVT